MGRLTSLAATLAATLTGTAACGDSGDGSPEVVVSDARLGGAAPQLLGVTPTTVFWSAPAGGVTRIAAAPLASLPATGGELASATGAVALAGDHVAFMSDGVISRVDATGAVTRITLGAPDTLAGNAAAAPVIAWSIGPSVSWGVDDAQRTVTLTRVDRCDHLWVSSRYVHVAADGTSGRRLLRIDQQSGEVTPVTASATWAPMFPRGGMAGSTYEGRIVAADDDAVLWLVEELPSRRAIVVREPVQGEPSVLLQYITGASGFFTSETALYWQERDTLLTAARTGGAAAIATELPGPAGAFADGFVYITRDGAIERLRVE